MPLYEFTCDACGARFEVLSASDELDDKTVCPQCGGHDVSRVFGSFAVGGHKGRVNPGTFVKPGKGVPPYHEPGVG